MTANLAVHVDIEASLATLAANEHVHEGGMLKLVADLDRYLQIVDATNPEVIVETGTHRGASASWFASLGVDVITVDIDHSRLQAHRDESVLHVLGDSADPEIAERVRDLVADRRCMVSLDSDHASAHVAREIDLYGPIVSPGCHLVVEDTIFGYADEQLRTQHCPGMAGSPLDAVAALLVNRPGWSRDINIERMSPVSHHPAGFWRKVG